MLGPCALGFEIAYEADPVSPEFSIDVAEMGLPLGSRFCVFFPSSVIIIFIGCPHLYRMWWLCSGSVMVERAGCTKINQHRKTGLNIVWGSPPHFYLPRGGSL